MVIGRPKGGKNRKWGKEDKLRIVKRYLDEGIGLIPLAKEENISSGQLHIWVKKYLDDGEKGLESKQKSGNPFAALTNSKSLTEVERLRLIIAKQEIEIERLKKGYIVKGDGANKEFITIKDMNSK
jgi:Transposase and inactivated derivatives